MSNITKAVIFGPNSLANELIRKVLGNSFRGKLAMFCFSSFHESKQKIEDDEDVSILIVDLSGGIVTHEGVIKRELVLAQFAKNAKTYCVTVGFSLNGDSLPDNIDGIDLIFDERSASELLDFIDLAIQKVIMDKEECSTKK